MTSPLPNVTNDHSRLTLTVTRGLPGSGKTTWAYQQLAQRPHGTVARCNRDDLRRMLHGTPRYDAMSEMTATAVQHAIIQTLLQRRESVIVDDTNLHLPYVDQLWELAHKHDADFSVVSFTHVPVEVCIQRDLGRKGTPAYVGEQDIRDMHTRHLTPTQDTPEHS
jgi:predicted kinase